MATTNDNTSGIVMADSLHVHELMELLPLQPSSTKKAQPLCLSASSCAMRSDILGGRHCLHMHAGACIDVNQISSSPEKQDELSSVDIHFTLGLSHDTQSSQNPRKRAPISGISGRTDPDAYRNVSSFEHEGTSKGISPHVSEVDEAGGSITRKKLRLSKEESSLLEESFKQHSTLNPKQKNTLAKQLNLRPRQVEVWFQNRRARNKLKQIEVDCELLQRCCDTLTEENKRLQREVAELQELKVQGSPACVIPQDFCKLLPTTTTMCPTCEHHVPCSPAVPVSTSSTTTSISSFCSEPSNLSLSFTPQQ